MDEEKEWGLPGFRDGEGRVNPIEHEFDHQGDTGRILFVPPSLTTIQEWQDLGEEMSVAQMNDIMDEYVLKPSIPDDEEWTGEEAMVFIREIANRTMQGVDADRAQAVAEALEERDTGDQGNSPQSSESPSA